MTDGVIVKGVGGFYYVSAKDGVYECRARGKFRRQGIKPMVGDKVKIAIVSSDNMEGAVDYIYERKNALVRPPVANIDCIVIVAAVTNPEPDYFMIDKLIVNAEIKNIDVIIAANKTDLKSYDKIKSIYENAGYEVFAVCAETGDGMEELKNRIRGKITAFAGNSGVGKSSILNRFGLSLQTGEISRIDRGKHTTRHVELFNVYKNTYVMDTPGFSILEITETESARLKEYFKEFKAYNDKCRFAGCDHYGAKPKDCAVINAVKSGDISDSRFESYTQLYSELKEVKKWDK